MKRRLLHLMTAWAALDLAAGAVLQGLRLAELAGLIAPGRRPGRDAADLATVGAAPVVVRLALFPPFVAFVVLSARSRPRTPSGRCDFNRVLAPVLRPGHGSWSTSCGSGPWSIS